MSDSPIEKRLKNFPWRKWKIAEMLIIALIFSGYFLVRYLNKHPETSDAFLHANIVYIAPQISGKIKRVNVTDYQTVAKGDLLFRIDPAGYEVAMEQARAVYEQTTGENSSTSDAILAASADIRRSNAQLTDIQAKYARTMRFLADGFVPAQAGDDARADLMAAKSALDSARAHMFQLIKEQGVLGKEAPAVKEAAAALARASLELSYTNLSAPSTGILGRVGVHVGSIVENGQALVPLVITSSFWMEANFKESDVGRIKAGMPADITLDMYPNKAFKGWVQVISPASGSALSPFPPKRAAGSWIKTPQRFPLKIRISPQQALPPLRVGASGTVSVNTVANRNDP